MDGAPKGGLDPRELSSPSKKFNQNYTVSKLGNWFLASEYAKRVGKDGIVSVAQNPGNLKTAIWDSAPKLIKILMTVTMHPPIYGAYSELWAGLSQGITVEDGGKYGVPWGKWHPLPRDDLLAAMKSEQEGGTGVAGKFWNWSEEETAQYI